MRLKQLALTIVVYFSCSVRVSVPAQPAPGTNQVPTSIAGNVAWWVADDRGTDLTVVDVTVPADPRKWSDSQKGFTITPDQLDPLGGHEAYRVMENSDVTWRWLTYEPPSYVTGPCKVAFHYKPVNGASVWEADGSTFYPEFEFNSKSAGRVGNHPYASADNTWFNVAPAANGFHKVDIWLQGATHVRKSVALSTVSNGTKPVPGDASQGFDLYGLTFSSITSRHSTTGHQPQEPTEKKSITQFGCPAACDDRIGIAHSAARTSNSTTASTDQPGRGLRKGCRAILSKKQLNSV